ncbi:MAG: hypothetical protein QOG18_289 [Microbacteriaceae bacterium]|jgi:DNA-binding PucR family transcriptional regulator|nr:hypothetical protein [Microbacteriaceae bacterium]
MTGLAPDGLTSYDQLGIYRVLGAGAGPKEIELFVQEWLEDVLSYGARNQSELAKTLGYLDCGGNYDGAAANLGIHRSTLRYRLQRIRQITEMELNDVDIRLNLHVATRAWGILSGDARSSP